MSLNSFFKKAYPLKKKYKKKQVVKLSESEIYPNTKLCCSGHIAHYWLTFVHLFLSNCPHLSASLLICLQSTLFFD